LRFAPDLDQTTYEMVWPDGAREEILGKNALLELIKDERKLARITAKSNEPIRQIMRAVSEALEKQRDLLRPIKRECFFLLLESGTQSKSRTSRESTEFPARNYITL
jgi:hypothetical protein